jgi:predicted RNA-binding protein (virulence factor B family)
MAEIGKINHLEVVKKVDFGVYLDGDELGEILLPERDVPPGCVVGEGLDVFVHLDSEDLLVATTQMPKAMVGECAFLKVVEINAVGAFLDWGLPKDLLVPYSEQQKPMVVGQSYVVYVYVDEETDRIAASSRLNKFVVDSSPYFKVQQKVELLICEQTDLGYKAVVNQSVIGLLFNSDVIRPVRVGETLQGYIKEVRSDKKLDLRLQLVSREALDDLSKQVMAFIQSEGGKTTLTDKSAPADIAKQFGVSKSSYKKALGKLYQKRLIVIEKHQVTLVK